MEDADFTQQNDNEEASEGTEADSKLIRLLNWATAIEPAVCIAAVDQALVKAAKKGRGGSGGYYDGNDREQKRKFAERLVSEFSRRNAAIGFAAGLPPTLALSVPAAVAERGKLLRQHAMLNGMIAYLADPEYFNTPDWKMDILILLAGVAEIAKEAMKTVGKNVTKQLIKKHISRGVLKAIKRWALKWLGQKITQRGIIYAATPVVSGLLGAGMNYGETKLLGARMIRYHFDDLLT